MQHIVATKVQALLVVQSLVSWVRVATLAAGLVKMLLSQIGLQLDGRST